MSLDLEHAKKVLYNCLVLIVDDDNDLAIRIASLFQEFTSRTPVVAHSIEGAMNKVIENDGQFGLAIVDLMLPLTEKDFKIIESLGKKLSKFRKIIMGIGASSKYESSEIAVF